MHMITIVPEALFETDHEAGGKMHYISCMLCSEHSETIVIALAVLHWQEFFEIFPLAVRTGMHFFTLTSLIPNMVQQELRLVYIMLMIHVDLQQQGMTVAHAIKVAWS